MTVMVLHTDIFEEMRRRLGCMYISDICNVPRYAALASLEALPVDAYSEEERRAFVRYVMGERVP